MSYLARTTVYAPGSIGNLGPGLDVLGCAVEGAGDAVVAEWCDEPGVVLREPGHPELPRRAAEHAAGIAALSVVRHATTLGTTHPARGIALSVRKGLPLAAGQGGSAASAVAGALAVNMLLGDPLDRDALLTAALDAESRVAGRHLDNVAPALLGGIVLVRSVEPIDLVAIPVPEALWIVLASPAQSLRTAEARAVLPRDVSRETAVHQAAQVAAIVAACHSGDLALLGRAIDDRIAEPARAPLLPGFPAARRAALAAGALGVSISGAGPTAFALCGERGVAGEVARAMCAAYEAAGVVAVARVARPDRVGARLEGERHVLPADAL
ncbi:MAG TPA: homoserine kinase [Gemmatimonadaceae bacterium]|nr:homoserine kinase [Gemmatimonadaceae bacterium]